MSLSCNLHRQSRRNIKSTHVSREGRFTRLFVLRENSARRTKWEPYLDCSEIPLVGKDGGEEIPKGKLGPENFLKTETGIGALEEAGRDTWPLVSS